MSLFAQRLACQREPMVALHQAVQHGVGHGLVANPLMPMFDGQLAGDDGRAVVGPVVNDLQQIGPGLTVHGSHAPVIEQQHIGALERVEPARERAVGVTYAQIFAQTRHALVQHAVTAPTGMLGQCAGQPGLARTGRPGDQHGVAAVNPLAQRQAHHRAAFQASRSAAVQVLNGGLRIFELGILEQACAASVLAPVHLAVDQQGQALLKAHGADAALRELLLQRLCHALQAQAAKLVQCGVHHHGGLVRVGSGLGG